MDFGNDSIFFQYNDKLTILALHNSNNIHKFIKQWNNVNNIIQNNYNLSTIIIFGDFNAIPEKQNNYLIFKNKNDFSIQYQLLINQNFIVSNLICTSFKIRCLTTQFEKMYKKVSSNIDGFIIISPYVQSIQFYSSFESNDFPPDNWFSDHSFISCFIDNLIIYSCNIMGESNHFNIYEFFTKQSWNQLQLLYKDRFEELYNTITYDFYSDNNIAICGRKFSICNIFLPPDNPNINKNTKFYLELK